MSHKVSAAMHRGAHFLPPDATLKDLAKSMQINDIGLVPIVEKEKLIGVVTDRDLVVRGLADSREPTSLQARDLMSTDVISCAPEESLKTVAKRMAKAQVRRLPVLSDSKLVGILGLGDITQAIDDDDECVDLVRAVTNHHA